MIKMILEILEFWRRRNNFEDEPAWSLSNGGDDILNMWWWAEKSAGRKTQFESDDYDSHDDDDGDGRENINYVCKANADDELP